jgi:hypothetical protein
MMAAARWHARSEPANSQLDLLCRGRHKRTNYLSARADLGGERAAAIYSLASNEA